MDAASVTPKLAPTAEDLQSLILEVRDMQRRLSSLEDRMNLAATMNAEQAPEPVQGVVIADMMPDIAVSADAVPTFGRALLGIAGAYMLRALTETGTLPRHAGVAAGIVYAVLWLWIAARTQTGRTLALTVNSITSMVILVPLLWEATVRLHAISSSTAAWVLAVFSIIGQAVSWRKNVTIVSGIVALSSGLIAMALLLATHDLLPFTLALLAIAAGVEFAACRDHAPGPRWMIALLADLAVIVFSALIDSKGGLPEGYTPSSVAAVLVTQALLLLIYMTSTAARTLLQHRPFTNFETAQSALAYVIGLGGMFQVAKGNSAATSTIGLFALFCGFVCYLISFVFLGREGKQNRNFYTYSTFAILTILAGSFLLFSGLGLVVVWCVLAIGCCVAGMLMNERLLELHGGISLLLAALISGAAGLPESLLFGDGKTSASLVAAGIISAVTFFCYLAVTRMTAGPDSSWNGRLTALLVAANLAWLLTGLATRTLAVVFQSVPAATLGTAVITSLSALMACCGVRWRRAELRWLVYGFMAIGAYKLVVVDFPLTNTAHMVVSLFLFGGTLILLPRILQKGHLAAN